MTKNFSKEALLDFLKVAALSLCAFLCIFWVLTIRSNENASWSESVWFFGVTYAMLQKFSGRSSLSFIWIVVAVILGRLAPEIPFYVFDFGSIVASLIFTLSSLLGIALASICFKVKHAAVFLLSIMMLVLFNSFVVSAWFDRVFCNF